MSQWLKVIVDKSHGGLMSRWLNVMVVKHHSGYSDYMSQRLHVTVVKISH